MTHGRVETCSPVLHAPHSRTIISLRPRVPTVSHLELDGSRSAYVHIVDDERFRRRVAAAWDKRAHGRGRARVMSGRRVQMSSAAGGRGSAPMTAMREFVGELKATLFRCLNPLLPIEPPYALVDAPNHANVGDGAISLVHWRGSRAIGAPPPRYVSDVPATVSPIYGSTCRTAPF